MVTVDNLVLIASMARSSASAAQNLAAVYGQHLRLVALLGRTVSGNSELLEPYFGKYFLAGNSLGYLDIQ